MSSRPDEATIRQAVRRSLSRLLADTPALPPEQFERRKRPVVDAESVNAVPEGGTLAVPAGALITPLARDVALARSISLQTGAPEAPLVPAPAERTVALAADHGGFQLKEALKETVSSLGYQVVDCGAFSAESVDYPDYAFVAASLVAQGKVRWAIIVDGAGIGSCMVANKVPGVRAALCYDQASAANSREHNHANVLTLGAGLIGPNLAKQIVSTWLETPFGSGRHARRVEKIMAIERRFAKP